MGHALPVDHGGKYLYRCRFRGFIILHVEIREWASQEYGFRVPVPKATAMGRNRQEMAVLPAAVRNLTAEERFVFPEPDVF